MYGSATGDAGRARNFSERGPTKQKEDALLDHESHHQVEVTMSRTVRRVASIDRDRPVPPYHSFSDFEYAFMTNVFATSGTVAHGQQRGRRGVRKGKPYAEYHGAALKAKTESNMRRRVAPVVVEAVRDAWSSSRFLAAVPGLIHYGVDDGHALRALRRHNTGMPYGCPASDVPRRWEAFRRELAKRLARREDPVEVVAWAEYEIRFGIHPLGDGCGRYATAVAAWIMLRSGQRIPNYAVADRSAFHAALRDGVERFAAFYRTQCVRPEVGDVDHGPFDRATAEEVVA